MRFSVLIAAVALIPVAACTQPYGQQGSASTGMQSQPATGSGMQPQQATGSGMMGGSQAGTGAQAGTAPGAGAAGYGPCPGMMGGPWMMGGHGMMGQPGMMGRQGWMAGGELPGVSGLTDSQRKSIGSIMEDFRQKQWPLMQQMHQQMMSSNIYRGGTADRAAADAAFDAAAPLHRQMFHNMIEMRARVDQVLTAQQREEWQRSWQGMMRPGAKQ